ncbi:MAG: 30S ribosomal protein S1 [Candidatus Adiutrix intracellularis]|jgi:small subunit ribosomal protein S1|nr:30S ribosomal protein S1 [Candidatus Adiutrix intracellularis]
MENFNNHDNNNQREDAVVSPENVSDQEQQSLAMDQLYEESFKTLSEGEVLNGTVVQIGKEYVMLDVGGKSEGRISIQEFLDTDGNLTIEIGQPVEALLVRLDDEDGEMILSKDKAAKIKVWEEITRIHNENGIISGLITSRVKGGLSVDIGLNAFLPGSQVDSRPIKNLESLVGQTFDFKILKYNKRRGNVVLSRRAILEVEREAQKQETLSVLETDSAVEGVVKNLTDYGAFIDLGGIDGLLHVTDMSWGRLTHPSELFAVGDKVTVKVLAFDREKSRVSLGLKQLQTDPWLTASEKYVVGERVSGRVVSLADYGAFVELDRGIEGLIHVSEMSWTRKVRNPASVLKVGDLVECVILKVDTTAKRISLGMKQIEPNPWDTVTERYPIGTIIEGKIKNITDFGVFIGIDEGIDGLVHISDISWTRRYKHPSDVLKKGDSVRALILAIDREQERFSLGIKQLEEDPWSVAMVRFPVGETTTGKLTNITDFGLFVELAEGVEGLIHVSESGMAKGKSLSEAYNLGDEVTAKVISISAADHKIGLSIKRLKKDNDDRLYKDYSSDKSCSGGSVSVLGEQLSKAFAAQNQNDGTPDSGGND